MKRQLKVFSFKEYENNWITDAKCLIVSPVVQEGNRKRDVKTSRDKKSQQREQSIGW
jgi:hypothetical protein